MILAVIMSLASVQVIQTSIQRIVDYADYDASCNVTVAKLNETALLCGSVSELNKLLGPCLSGASGPVVELTTIVICCVTIGTNHKPAILPRRSPMAALRQQQLKM